MYENGRYAAGWMSWLSNQPAYHVERMWGDDGAVPMDTARLESKRLMPADARFVRTYTWGDNLPVDVYTSASLEPRIDPNFWFGSEPGTFIVLYRFTRYPFRGDKTDRVTSLVAATGNNP